MIKEFFNKCLDHTTLSNSAYDNARDKYNAIGEYLEEYFLDNYNIDVKIYSQGTPLQQRLLFDHILREKIDLMM